MGKNANPRRYEMTNREIELVYFEGCPNADQARENLRAALKGEAWKEWDLSSPDTPDRVRRHGSPTVLIGGRDVTGAPETAEAMSCRADGAPSPDVIREGIAGRG